MNITTKAIVISKIRYKDADLIVKCYTKKFGIVSYLIRNVLKSKKGKIKASYFQALSLLELEAEHKNNRSLKYIKEAKVSYPLNSIQSNVIKSTISIFLSEVLSNILREEESNKNLYQFIETSIIWFEENEVYPNFHFIFLLELSKYLGFYPELTAKHFDYFDLSEGKFTQSPLSNYCISGENLILFKELLGIKFDVNKTIRMNSVQKQELLNMILLYFELHLDGFKKPKSLEVLSQVFH